MPRTEDRLEKYFPFLFSSHSPSRGMVRAGRTVWSAGGTHFGCRFTTVSSWGIILKINGFDLTCIAAVSSPSWAGDVTYVTPAVETLQYPEGAGKGGNSESP